MTLQDTCVKWHMVSKQSKRKFYALGFIIHNLFWQMQMQKDIGNEILNLYKAPPPHPPFESHM